MQSHTGIGVHKVQDHAHRSLISATGVDHGVVACAMASTCIKTGPDLSSEELTRARWPLPRRPYLLETSLPGIFAAGDVRGGNVKRVASAVGEGSISISFVHQLLRE